MEGLITMLPYKSLFVLLTVLAISWLIPDTAASAIRPYRSQLDDKTRQEVISLADRIAKVAVYGTDWDEYSKRNGGTADAIYNLPDLGDVGKSICGTRPAMRQNWETGVRATVKSWSKIKVKKGRRLAAVEFNDRLVQATRYFRYRLISSYNLSSKSGFVQSQTL